MMFSLTNNSSLQFPSRVVVNSVSLYDLEKPRLCFFNSFTYPNGHKKSLLRFGNTLSHQPNVVTFAASESSNGGIIEKKIERDDEYFMSEALKEAQKAFQMEEVPVGAVIVKNGKIISRAHNMFLTMVEFLCDPCAHAEILCIRKCCSKLCNWRLLDCTLYVTLEPCVMCGGSILQSRVRRLVWGAPNNLLGCDGSWISLLPNGENHDHHHHHNDDDDDNRANDNAKENVMHENVNQSSIHPFHTSIEIRRGVLREECALIMKRFFSEKRKHKKESMSNSKQEEKKKKKKKRFKSIGFLVYNVRALYYNLSLWRLRFWE